METKLIRTFVKLNNYRTIYVIEYNYTLDKYLVSFDNGRYEDEITSDVYWEPIKKKLDQLFNSYLTKQMQFDIFNVS